MRTARFVLLLLSAALCGSIFAPSAFATAPKITFCKPSNLIAYDSPTLNKTTFRTKVDTSTVHAHLYVKSPKYGDITIYSGTIRSANTTFSFPAWSGRTAKGKRLPTSAGYTWVLHVTKGSEEATKTGKISISAIAFTMKGKTGSKTTNFYRYLIPGKVNCYVTASGTFPDDTPAELAFCSFQVRFFRDVGTRTQALWEQSYTVSSDKPHISQVRGIISGGTAPAKRGKQLFQVRPMLGAGSATYSIAVIQ